MRFYSIALGIAGMFVGLGFVCPNSRTSAIQADWDSLR